MPIYRPRALLVLTVPVAGDRAARRANEKSSTVFTIVCRVSRVTVVTNDHNHADEVRVTVDWKEAGVDPRLIRNASGDIYMDNADERGVWEPSLDNLAFTGFMTRPIRSAEEDGPMSVDMEFLDYTTLFLEAKPFGSLGVPKYSMRLDEAWRTVCSQTPGAEALAGRLFAEGFTQFPLLGTAVAARFAQIGRVPVKPNTDAWAVWQQCCGMMGLISYISLDRCIVTTALHYYTAKDPPKLIWGKNLSSMHEARNPFARKGIGLTSFDPASGRALEAYWPPIGDTSLRHKKIAAKKIGQEAATRQAEDREWFRYNQTTNPAILLECARNVYEERSRQELEGVISTSEMFVDTVSGGRFNLLKLKAGDNIRVEFDPLERELLSNLPTETARMLFLEQRGYAHDVAVLKAKTMSDFALLDPTMYVKRVQKTLEIDDDAGDFEVEITYVNRILIDGNADASHA